MGVFNKSRHGVFDPHAGHRPGVPARHVSASGQRPGKTPGNPWDEPFFPGPWGPLDCDVLLAGERNRARHVCEEAGCRMGPLMYDPQTCEFYGFFCQDCEEEDRNPAP